ncbi:MAG TPA: cytochrome c peroxidase [Bryobacteraceae bacterium]|nr:cytochrome c peroxidase [Bryobacteraceae bacterium]
MRRRCTTGAALILGFTTVLAQEPVFPIGSLKGIRPVDPPNLGDFVRDRKLAVVLGKALFWDMQAGSDGVQACASCHYSAGADNRARNQISPAVGKLGADWLPAPDQSFSVGGGPNYELKRSDFPFHKLQDVNNRNSVVLSDSNAVVSSQGVHRAKFLRSCEGCPADVVQVTADPTFNVNGVNVRQVPHRSTPSVINAAFNFRQYWDGRAQDVFNGVNGWGDRDPDAKVLKASGKTLAAVRIRLTGSSLASQAVGPPLNDLEASAHGRSFADIGSRLTPAGRRDRDILRKLKTSRPLGKQLVAPDDSVLGPYSAFPLRGLHGRDAGSYEELIRKTFKPEWWDSPLRVVVRPDKTLQFLTEKEAKHEDEAYSLMEYNFSLFFGIAIQLYESTLISDDTPFDRFMAGDQDALTAEQKAGLALYSDNVKVRCINCHGGPELTNAAASLVRTKTVFRRSGNLIDTGFNNIGLRPTREDRGVGGNDPFGKPLAEARIFRNQDRAYNQQFHGTLAVDGAFKAPGLRNVELTAPYFHTGSMLTLRQVIDFYSRGGDFQPIDNSDGPSSPLSTLNLQDAEKEKLVAFLNALTDDRVRYQRAPFDHPELFVPDGQVLDTRWVLDDGTGRAVDRIKHIAPVGRYGSLLPVKGLLD